MAALQPHRGAAGGLRRPGPGLLVPVHDPGADDTRHLSPLPAAAHRGRAVDGGLRRVLGGHGKGLATERFPLSVLLPRGFSWWRDATRRMGRPLSLRVS